MAVPMGEEMVFYNKVYMISHQLVVLAYAV